MKSTIIWFVPQTSCIYRQKIPTQPTSFTDLKISFSYSMLSNNSRTTEISSFKIKHFINTTSKPPPPQVDIGGTQNKPVWPINTTTRFVCSWWYVYARRHHGRGVHSHWHLVFASKIYILIYNNTSLVRTTTWLHVKLIINIGWWAIEKYGFISIIFINANTIIRFGFL